MTRTGRRAAAALAAVAAAATVTAASVTAAGHGHKPQDSHRELPAWLHARPVPPQVRKGEHLDGRCVMLVSAAETWIVCPSGRTLRS